MTSIVDKLGMSGTVGLGAGLFAGIKDIGIFKTFDSGIDKISSKWGMFGRSFNDIGSAISGRINDINHAFQATDDLIGSIKDSDSIWKRLYPGKESIKSKLIDVDATIPKLSIEDASNLTKQIREQLDAVNSGSKSWEEYFKILKDNNQNYVVDLIKNTDDLTKLEGQDLVNACDNARKTVIAQNKEIEGMSLKAKAGRSALKGLAIAGNMVAGWLLTKAIEIATEKLYEFIHASEIARDKSAELTNNWTKENSSIDKSINRYKELSEKLNDASLSASEVKSVKEDLIEVQKSLTDKYGQEALGIDLVNGKYDEQIKKLKALSKEKAGNYVAENYSNIQADRKYISEKVNLSAGLGFYGSMSDQDDYHDVGFDLKKYLDRYDKLNAKVVETDGEFGLNGEFKLITDGTREEVYDQISQLFNDLNEDFGNSDENVNKFKNTISKILQDSFDTEQLEKSKNNVKKYAEAEILSQNNTRQLYEDAVDSVDKYNEALQSGKGIETAKKNLDSVKEKVNTATSDISGASAVFEDVYDGINKTAESAYNVSKAFENNDSVKKYAEELRGLSSDDLLKIDFEDNVQSPGEAAFKALIDIIGLSEDEVQTLIDKLVELGYVEGEVGKKSDNKKLSFSKILSDADVDDYQKKLSSLESYLEKFRSGEFSSSDKTSLLTEFGIVADSAEEAAEKIQKWMDKVTNSIVTDLKEVLNGDNISEATRKKIEALIQSLEDANREAQSLSSVKLTHNALADVQSLSSGLDQLDKVYADILDKEDFDFSSVFSTDFKKEFGAYTDEYNKFVETVTSSPDDINACQEAFNNLASAYVYGSGVLDEVTESTKASCIAMLEQMGVSNAAAVVEQALIENEKMLEAQKYATAHGCDDLTNATYREITSLIEEGTASENVRKYLAKLVLEKWNVNKEELKTKADCDRLLDLAKQAGATRNQINRLKNAIADLNTVDFTNPMGTMFDTLTGKALEKLAKANPNIKKTALYKQFVGKNKKAKKEIDDINAEIEKDLNKKLNINPVTPTYSGGTTTNDTRDKLAEDAKKARDDAKKSQEDIQKAQENLNKALEKTEQEFDGIDIQLNNLIDSASKAKDKIDDLLTFGAKKKQTQKAIEETIKAIEAEYKAIKKYSAYADTTSGKAAEKASIEKAKEIAQAQAELNDAIANANTAVNTASNIASSTVSGAVDTSVGVVNDALQYVGKLPYVWGSASLTTGADCSGFVP